MKKLLSFCLVALMPVSLVCSAEERSNNKKILFIAGPQSHQVGEHEHRAGCLLLIKALKESGLDVDTELYAMQKGDQHLWPQDENLFEEVDTAIVYADAAGRMDQKTLDRVQQAVDRGMGLMFIHYGVHPSVEVGEKYFMQWIGGYFNNDVSVNPHWFATLTPNSEHPVKNGIDKVEANDEWYYNMLFNAEHQVLASALVVPERITKYNNIWHQPGDDQFGKQVAIMWANKPKDENASRGVGFTGGHYHSNWAVDNFRKLVLNAIVWTAKIDVPENGVESKPLTVEDMNRNIDGFAPDAVIDQIAMPSLTLDTIKVDARPEDPANYMANKRKAREAAQRKKEAERKAKEQQ
ncbi:ThuA domain-containing protein [Rubritalea marina]|uniref:ThuA domain-containing protein n=1 Tax=Rubritalea marina TaxID=361055 RepID=UPI00036315BD|nr:ThuA domain-containing protein [Rubritalea marina]